jgi:hypothetical protein
MRRIQKQITRRHTAAPASEQEVRSFDRSTLGRADQILALIEEITNQRR